MAIPFRTPKYKTQQLDQPVEVQLQLVRPSDNFRSESVPFQMLPLGAGRPAFWSLRKAFARKKLQDDCTGLLSNSNNNSARQDPALEYNNNNNNGFKRSHEKMSALRALNDMYRVKNGEALVDYQGNSVRSDCLERSDYSRSDWLGNSEVGKWVLRAQETKAKIDLERAKCSETDDIVSQVEELDMIYVDTQTKLATDPMSNPNASFDVADNQTYTSLQMAMKNPMELLEIPEMLEATTAYEDVANDSMEETLIAPPPIVPKRDVNMEVVDERVPPLPPKRIRKIPSAPVLEAAPEKSLPSPPANFKPNKQGLLSKFFVKNKTKKEKELEEKLDGDESPPYGVELTEAEHYALYTAMAPHATASEFDEFSVYYSPIEDGKIYKGT